MTGIYYSFGSHCIAANKLSLISSRQKCDRNQEADRHKQVCVVPVSPVEKTSLLFFFFLKAYWLGLGFSKPCSCRSPGSAKPAAADILHRASSNDSNAMCFLLCACVRQVCVHACVCGKFRLRGICCRFQAHVVGLRN